MTAGYQPDWLHCDLNRSRAFPGTKCRHSEPLKQLLFVWTHWIDISVITCKVDAGRAITLRGDRVMPSEASPCHPERMAEGSQNLLPAGLDQFSQSEAETWTGWDRDATETVPCLSVCPHHLSSVMALPHRPCVLSPTRYSFWRSAPGSWILAAASASQPWDKSLQQISVMDGFQKRYEEQDLPNLDNKLLINESLWP